MKKIICFLLVTFLLINICLPVQAQSTQLETKECQIKIYDTKDIKMVMKAAINVLQDEGFIINNSNTGLGVITATKEIIKKNPHPYRSAIFKGTIITLFGYIGYSFVRENKKDSKIEATVNFSELNNQSKVRVNFAPITDEKCYQDFFAKVDKGIFIQKEKI